MIHVFIKVTSRCIRRILSWTTKWLWISRLQSIDFLTDPLQSVLSTIAEFRISRNGGNVAEIYY